LLGEAFEALESEVAFASFEAAEVGAVDAEPVREGFLAQAQGESVGAQVLPHDALEIADGHAFERSLGAT